MSRVLKFRAWNKEKGIMVYSNEDDSSSWWDGIEESTVNLINTYLMGGVEPHYLWMQFTGLLDKNGKEVYESDIVRAHFFLFDGGDSEFVGEVAFGSWGSWVISKDTNDEECEMLEFIQTSHFEEPCIEILGNKYEHPELLDQQ